MTDDRHHIMLVEDSLSQAVKMTHILEQAGWQVTCANSAEQAFAKLNTIRPDLVLLDLYLPGMRGDEVCRRIRRHIDSRNLPVVILTSEDSSEAELRGLDSGADDFISKGSDSGVLILRLRALLSKVHRQSTILRPTERSFRSARLLAIDDSATFLARLRPELESEGYEVETALDPKGGLERVRMGEFDGVIIDLAMPGLDGLEVCRRIDGWRKTTEAPLVTVILTGQETKDDHARALQAGADDFVGKSSDISVLKGRIRALLRRKFFEEENRKILSELRKKELEAVRERAEKEAAQARVQLVEQLERTADELRRSQQELQLANQAKDQFLAILSHELRTPLTPVLATISLWQEDERLPELVREQVSMVRRNVELEARLIDDLLDLTKIARGKLELRSSLVEMRGLVEHAVSICQTNDESAARIENQFPAENFPIWGDGSRLTQILWNLLRNAVKFTPADGRIIVRGFTEASARDAGKQTLCIEVEDSGIGIEPELLPSIFSAFEQGGREITRQFGGLGLGLAISRAIAELHGGTLSARSEGRNRGSTFRLTLPLYTGAGHPEPAGGKEEKPASEAVASARGLSILLVEDHVDTACAMERLLRRRAHEVRRAESVTEAKRLLAEEKFDLLISDLGLPDGSGYDVLHALPELQRLPAIALSGYGMEEDITRAKAAGFQFHFTKPVDFAALDAAIAAIALVPK